MNNLLTRFVQEEDGVTAIEYGLIAGLIAVVILGAFGLVTNGLTSIFTKIGNTLTSAASS